MKRNFGFMCVMLLAMATLTACLDSDNDANQDRWRPVAPGLQIYNATVSQNHIALQPSDIAIRLAILRAEAAKQGKLDKLDMVVIPNGGNVKMLLFGANTKITAEKDGYLISYVGGGGVNTLDSYARMGDIRIRTHGVGLEQTNATTRWTVELASAKMTFDDRHYDKTMMTSTGDTYIYNRGTAYEIGFSGSVAYVRPEYTSDWKGTFIWTPATPADLSFSTLQKSIFKLDGAGSGRSFWTMNGKASANMSYAVTNGKYDPSIAGSAQIVAGTEVCRLTNPADYNVADYPASDVAVSWSVTNNRLYYTVDYNGFSVSM
ncbi:MAG: hypothetical protein RRZ83_04775 [Alistipes sp.]